MATAKKPTASKPKAAESKPETSEPKAEIKAPKRKAITTPKKVLDGVQRENYVTVEFIIDMPKQKINKGDQYSVGKSTADSLVKLKRAKIL